MYTEKTENDFLVGTSDVLAMDGTNAVNGPVISAKLGGAKIPVGVEVTVVGGASAASLTIAYSFDGVNFSDETELIADITATQTGVKLAMADLSAIQAPYYRLSLGGVTSLGTSGRFKLIYAVPADQYV